MAIATSTEAHYTTTARAILRCTRKGCRKAHTTMFATTVIQSAHDGRMVEHREVTYRGHTRSYRDRYDIERMVTRDFVCAACGGHSADFAVVQGTFSESVKCGPRCRNAVGASCDCQCGGENHATGHVSV